MRTRWKMASKEDVADVASRLRKADRDEGRALLGVDPALYLPYAFDPERTWVIFNAKGENVALAGVYPMQDDLLGQVWMVSTDKLLDHQIEFLKYTPKFIDMLHETYPILFNWIDERNKVHIKWLQWCGFTFIRRNETWGAEGLPFLTFCRIK